MFKQLLTILIIALAAACSHPETSEIESSSETETVKRGHQIIDGIERSELALTMRKMYDDMKLVRDSLKNGLEVSPAHLQRYRSIHTDVATEPEKIDETYRAMAGLFLTQYESFENDTSNRVAAFNMMLDGCVACHQNKCPGPIKAINKLRI